MNLESDQHFHVTFSGFTEKKYNHILYHPEANFSSAFP